MAKPVPLPPGVQVWRDDRDDQDFPGYMLVERLPFTPSCFILGRYETFQAALDDAWDAVTRHGAGMAALRAHQEHAAAKSAERRLERKKVRNANGE